MSAVFATRALERVLPVPALHRIAESLLRFRARRHGIPDRAPEIVLPPFFDQPNPVRMTTIGLMLHYHLNSQVEFFPDRLANPKWQERCRVIGLEPVRRAIDEKRPVIVAFCHFGAYQLMGYWLRALGLPAATIVAGEVARRSQLNRLKSRWSPFRDMPTVFHQDRLPEMIKFLKSGKLLLVALDAPSGKQLDVPIADGWTFQTATGGLRLAAKNGAKLFFASMIEEGPWRFCLEFGQPVPPELLTNKDDPMPAAKFLLADWLACAKKFPGQMSPKKIRLFKKIESEKNQIDETIHPQEFAA
ncbi:MAG TPA: hypothetical protein VFV23_06170 [Verrucomicrobiae bacterium]|nr:hypothetical protein [Verrucomicrobiae bacterium]